MRLLLTSRWGSQYIVTNSTNRQFMYNTPMYTYEHPRPAVTVDIVVFNLYTGLAYVLLIQRAAEPFIGMWALPGGLSRWMRVWMKLQDASWKKKLA